MPWQITVILYYRLAQCIHNTHACVRMFFSSVTDPRHWCPGQLQRHITRPVCSSPKPNSHIPRFPQPRFPNQSWISVSRFHMSDGYSWESSMSVFWFITMSLSFLQDDVFERMCSLFLCFIHRKQKVKPSTPQSVSLLKPGAQLYQHSSLMGKLPLLQVWRISLPWSHSTLTIFTGC